MMGEGKERLVHYLLRSTLKSSSKSGIYNGFLEKYLVVFMNSTPVGILERRVRALLCSPFGRWQGARLMASISLSFRMKGFAMETW